MACGLWVGFLVRSTGAFLLFLPSSGGLLLLFGTSWSRGPGVQGLLFLLLQLLQVTLACSITTGQGKEECCVALHPAPCHPSIHPQSTSPCLSVCPIHPPSSLFPSYITRTKYPLFPTNKPTPPKPTTQPAPGRLTAIGSRLCKSMVSGTDTLHPAGLAKCPCPALPLLHSIQTT